MFVFVCCQILLICRCVFLFVVLFISCCVFLSDVRSCDSLLSFETFGCAPRGHRTSGVYHSSSVGIDLCGSVFAADQETRVTRGHGHTGTSGTSAVQHTSVLITVRETHQHLRVHPESTARARALGQ